MKPTKKRTIINAPVAMLRDFMASPQDAAIEIAAYGLYRCAIEVDETAQYAKTEGEKAQAIIKAYAVYGKKASSFGMMANIYDLGQRRHYDFPFRGVTDKKPATFGVSLDVLSAFYKEEKTNHEVAAFLMFCAIKSILGRKPHCLTNYGLIASRMAGFDKTSFRMGTKSTGQRDLLLAKEGVHVSEELFDLIAIRSRLNKTRTELELNWRVIYYGGNRGGSKRGFYVGIDKGKDNLKKMIAYAISQQKGTKKDGLAEKKKLAKAEVLAELGR